MTFTTLAFMAESGHGKDFCGAYVGINYNFQGIAFADHIKRFCNAVFKEFTVESLWGEAKLRNTPVEVDWVVANSRLVWSVDDWVARLLNLSIAERAEYKGLVERWFEDLKNRVNGGPVTPRMALQLLGTEYGRHFRKDIWSSYLMTQIVPEIQEGANYVNEIGVVGVINQLGKPAFNGVIITDCRFLNELEEVQRWGGYVIKIVRNSLKGKSDEVEGAGIKDHASEAEMRTIPDEAFDLILEMDDGPDNVYPRLKKMMDEREFEHTRSRK